MFFQITFRFTSWSSNHEAYLLWVELAHCETSSASCLVPMAVEAFGFFQWLAVAGHTWTFSSYCVGRENIAYKRRFIFLA